MHYARRFALIVGLVITLSTFAIIFKETTQKRRLPMETDIPASSFALTSPVFANNEPIPVIYTCKGQNTRPPLSVADPPKGSKSLAIVMRDPDAPSGEWIHWLMWNIHPTISTIDEKSTPPGAVEGTASSGKQGYGGPCPPAGSGIHHYIFDLYALDADIALPASANHEQLDTAIQPHRVGHARLTGTFSSD